MPLFPFIHGVVQSSEAFSPADISGLTAWYGDDVNSGVDRTTLSNGTAITQWDDLSGNGYHLTNAGTPTYYASNNSIQLDSSSALGRITSFPLTGQTFTVFTVMEVYSADGNNNTDSYHLFIGNLDTGDYIGVTNRQNANSINVQSPPAAQRLYSGDQVEQNETAILTHVNIDNTMSNFTLRKDGVELSPSTAGSGSLDTSYQDKYIIGGYVNNSGLFPWNNGKQYRVFENVIFDRALSTLEIQQVETYLNDKYSIY